jgi:hypothetical protein
MKKKTLIIIAAIIATNIVIMDLIQNSPIPKGSWAEVYYSHLFLYQAIGNLGAAIGVAIAKKWKIAFAFGCCGVLLFLLAASA